MPQQIHFSTNKTGTVKRGIKRGSTYYHQSIMSVTWFSADTDMHASQTITI